MKNYNGFNCLIQPKIIMRIYSFSVIHYTSCVTPYGNTRNKINLLVISNILSYNNIITIHKMLIFLFPAL